MDRIYRIPVLGYIINIMVSVVRAPIRYNGIKKIIKNHENTIEEQNNKINGLKEIIRNYENTIEEQNNEINGLKEIIRKHENAIEEQNSAIDVLNENSFDRKFEELLLNDVRLKRLNLQLSIRPTIWGEENRLHISPLAAVSSCFFNTNSGEIEIGEYTFAGSNVSILAGSHDKVLTGLERRDCEYKEGCNIHIGKGVWLASGCTILGPCSINDNAVVAAGAVVTPGTIVPANTIYGGTPARQIGDLQNQGETREEHLRMAMKREGGTLFCGYWTEKRQRLYNGKSVIGHWLYENEACIRTTKNSVKIFFCVDGGNAVCCWGKNQVHEIKSGESIQEVDFGDLGKEKEIKIIRKNMETQVFCAVLE